MMNLSDLLASIPNIFREVKICVCTIVCFCREINRLVILHQDVHRCRPLAHPLGRWCQGCARDKISDFLKLELVKLVGKPVQTDHLLYYFIFVASNERAPKCSTLLAQCNISIRKNKTKFNKNSKNMINQWQDFNLSNFETSYQTVYLKIDRLDTMVSEGHGANYFPSLFWSSESRPRTPHYSDNLIIVSLTEAVTGPLIMIASSQTKRATTIPSANLVYGPSGFMLLPIYVSVEDKSNNSATGIVFSQKCSEEKWLTIYAVKTPLQYNLRTCRRYCFNFVIVIGNVETDSAIKRGLTPHSSLRPFICRVTERTFTLQQNNSVSLRSPLSCYFRVGNCFASIRYLLGLFFHSGFQDSLTHTRDTLNDTPALGENHTEAIGGVAACSLDRCSISVAKMKHLWPLLAWIFLVSYPTAESRNGLGHGLRREVFFLNLEDGYFGCQVNESTDILQLLELSKLCDHRTDCYQGADEQRNKLKCTGELPVGKRHISSNKLEFIRTTVQKKTAPNVKTMRTSVNIGPVIYLPTVQILLAASNVPASPDIEATAFIARHSLYGPITCWFLLEPCGK
ncbi:hypothetical protein EAG_11998 [Camponotus floridanus]|uniref:Uncharacterized protein n=1 Tax=Camponotus floridanus TaxID=104421 RepID=E2AA81_CAMFO|nr:hypothetical protein EAG_11998 [Camponotus floridanus]